jgi:hypothetical protein
VYKPYRRNIVYSSIQDLKIKLGAELKMLEGQTRLSFDKSDPECQKQVPVYLRTITGLSQATSVRLKVQTDGEMQQRDVMAYMTKIQKFTKDRDWLESKAPESVQLTWTDTDAIVTDFMDSSAKYVNVLHVDHNDNKLTIWRAPMPLSLVEFFKEETSYRLTISVMERQFRIEVDWKGRWDTIRVDEAGELGCLSHAIRPWRLRKPSPVFTLWRSVMRGHVNYRSPSIDAAQYTDKTAEFG